MFVSRDEKAFQDSTCSQRKHFAMGASGRDTPKMMNKIVQLIRINQSTRQKWLNLQPRFRYFVIIFVIKIYLHFKKIHKTVDSHKASQ